LSRSDKWLCMMYPRLKLLRELLKEDGVIFISIDDNEVHNLRNLCDEIFGEENFVTSISRATKMGGKNGDYFSPSVDYILTFAD
ncbi:MAG: site-specific DNA-methyltransferase, partial [Bacteroidales bacterium]|nr:site-specific DNA-methyltransferase [Bacteroidales bacterium]